MKLYIPTTSRNFNCLFSEESISPRAFYKVRGFGYSNWHAIAENPYENCTILYDELKFFSRPNEGYDDYPLVIETEIPDKIRALMIHNKKTGSFAYDGVLYFNPKATRFIFFDDKHRDIALSKATGSLETKLVNVYVKKIVVERPKVSYDVPVFEEPLLNDSEIEFSRRINKVKGFAFGYYIGSLLSTSKEQALNIQRYQNILNIAAAIASSIDKRPTPRQEEQLRALCNNNRLPNALAKEFNLSENTSSAILHYLIQRGWTPDEQTKVGSNLYNSIVSPDGQEAAIKWLTSKLDMALSSVSGDLKKNPSQKEIELCNDATVDFNLYKSDGKKEQYELISLWVNKIFADNKYQGSLSSYRSQLADDLTTSAKTDVYGDGWQDSKTRIYMNSVRHNIAGEEFTEKWSDGILCSVAAVLMKGDTWEGLRKFMLSEGLSDYSLAFALYGMLTGFASLPRDFMDNLWRFTDKKYPVDVYFSIANMVLETRINQIKEDDLPSEYLENNEIPEVESENEGSFIDKVKDFGKEIIAGFKEENHSVDEHESQLENSDEFSETCCEKGGELFAKDNDFIDKEKSIERRLRVEETTISKQAQDYISKIEEIFPTGKSGRDKKIAYYSREIATAFFESAVSAEDAIAKIESIKPFKNNDGWGKVKSELTKELKSKVKLEKIQAEKEKAFRNSGNLFSESQYNLESESQLEPNAIDVNKTLFLNDPKALDLILSQLPQGDKEVSKNVTLDFEWFVGNYNQEFIDSRGKRKQGWYKDSPKDNFSVLENYRKHLINKQDYNPSASWISPIFSRIDVNRVIDFLKMIYK